ncbi:cytochrome p450 domain protein [Mycobacteroides abscessus 1948]|uniref:Cytochrome p450 domain protein n=1 Tax=Mycobacteroides abscessus 1948 TaxID=1299323 RepID=A0A829QCD4_9MYCO|nr:cytochrome p450 domain protein [Mycobacteroides abscessus 1948]
MDAVEAAQRPGGTMTNHLLAPAHHVKERLSSVIMVPRASRRRRQMASMEPGLAGS